MIVDLPDTTVSKISKSLVNLREEGGAVALGRVLTLIIATSPDEEEHAIEAAKAAQALNAESIDVLVLSHAGEGRIERAPDARGRALHRSRRGGCSGAGGCADPRRR